MPFIRQKQQILKLIYRTSCRRLPK
jgi:hypothetical protein